jgi:hypothetical protein
VPEVGSWKFVERNAGTAELHSVTGPTKEDSRQTLATGSRLVIPYIHVGNQIGCPTAGDISTT